MGVEMVEVSKIMSLQVFQQQTVEQIVDVPEH